MALMTNMPAFKWILVIVVIVVFVLFVHLNGLTDQTGSDFHVNGINFKLGLLNKQPPESISKERNSEVNMHERWINNIKGMIDTTPNTSRASSVVKYKYENIMKMKPIRFLHNFKNPCWNGTDDNGPINDNKLHCLPYFYILGMKKCGTTDLFARLVQHPEVVSPGFKEAQWFPLHRFNLTTSVQKQKGLCTDAQFTCGDGACISNTEKCDGKADCKDMSDENSITCHLDSKDPRPLAYYINMFEQATSVIQLHHNKFSPENILITGEGTPANLHSQGHWDTLPGNEDLSEPRYTNLHYIKHLTPDVKIIVIFCNPVDRLYSDFLMDSPRLDARAFHRSVIFVIALYRQCFQRFSFRQCMFNYTLMYRKEHRFAFTAAFYAFHMKEIRSVFAPKQILPLFFDDYISDMEKTLQRVFKFLDVSVPDRQLLNEIMQMKPRNSGSKRKKIAGPMLDETRDLLEEYYRPYNEEMARLMNDDRYLFNK